MRRNKTLRKDVSSALRRAHEKKVGINVKTVLTICPWPKDQKCLAIGGELFRHLYLFLARKIKKLGNQRVKENKITYLLYKMICPIMGLFCPNTSKSEIPTKVRLLFLRCM